MKEKKKYLTLLIAIILILGLPVNAWALGGSAGSGQVSGNHVSSNEGGGLQENVEVAEEKASVAVVNAAATKTVNILFVDEDGYSGYRWFLPGNLNNWSYQLISTSGGDAISGTYAMGFRSTKQTANSISVVPGETYRIRITDGSGSSNYEAYQCTVDGTTVTGDTFTVPSGDAASSLTVTLRKLISARFVDSAGNTVPGGSLTVKNTYEATDTATYSLPASIPLVPSRTYGWTYTAPENYSSTVQGSTVGTGNTSPIEILVDSAANTVHIPVEVVWDDNDNADGKRPTQAVIRFYYKEPDGQGKTTISPTLNDSNHWTTELVKEIDVSKTEDVSAPQHPGYVMSASLEEQTDGTQKCVLTFKYNTTIPETSMKAVPITLTLSGNSYWDEKITFNVTVSGNGPAIAPVTVTAKEGSQKVTIPTPDFENMDNPLGDYWYVVSESQEDGTQYSHDQSTFSVHYQVFNNEKPGDRKYVVNMAVRRLTNPDGSASGEKEKKDEGCIFSGEQKVVKTGVRLDEMGPIVRLALIGGIFMMLAGFYVLVKKKMQRRGKSS
ncbi:MAG: hypothetical protein VZR02_00325 [Lachnospiraceae bacterium]|nr:hypothetical protein [Lachnospiraceae bacterium]